MRTVRKPKWNKNDDGSNLNHEQIEHALADLYDSNNEISTWLIYSDQSNLDRVVAAVAAQREHLDTLDYALIDFALLDQFGIQWEHTPEHALVPDPEVRKWHHDVTGSTAEQLTLLINAVVGAEQVHRKTLRSVKELIARELRRGHIVRDEMSLTPGNMAIIDHLFAQMPVDH